MKLVIFDLDGTLVASVDSDAACYLEALADAFPGIDVDQRWDRYAHVTDAWITAELLRRHLGREPAAADVARVRAAFRKRIERACAAEDAFPPVAGAATLLRRLWTEAGWTVALGTGGWGDTSRLKLQRAELEDAFVAVASADDDPTREGVIQTARRRAEACVGAPAERVVYVGDALWDIEACRNLGLPFIGIGQGRRASALREAGAGIVFPDLQRVDAIREALERAAPPF